MKRLIAISLLTISITGVTGMDAANATNQKGVMPSATGNVSTVSGLPATAGVGVRVRSGPCTGPRGFVTNDMPVWEQQQKVRWLIACANLQFPVPGGLNYALAIASRESGLRPYAKNPSSSASGCFQFISSTWDSLVGNWPVMNRWTGTWVFSARANVLRAMRLAHEAGWGAWGG